MRFKSKTGFSCPFSIKNEKVGIGQIFLYLIDCRLMTYKEGKVMYI